MDSSSTPQFYQQSYSSNYPSSKPYNSTAAAAAAAAAAVGLPTPSLPPLSQLLPTASNTVRHTVLSHAQPPVASSTTTSTSSSLSDPTTAAAVAAATVDHQLQYPPRQPYFAQPQATAYEQPVVPSNILPVFSTTTPTPTAHHLPSPPQSCTDGLSPAAVMAAQAAAAAAASNTTHHPVSATDPNASQKVFSFVPIPGVNHKKRPRRKYHEVERLYHCNYPGCTKAYGTLNHLNAHVSMQSHGPKRLPSEFKELRKQWRKQKREREATRQQQQENAAAAVAANNTQYHHHQAAAAAAAPPPPPPFLPSHSSTPSYLPWQHQQGYPGPPHQQAEFADLATLPGAPPF